jgi:uncharacterized protein YxjI
MRFRMRTKMFSIGDDYWIENDDGDKVYKVDGKKLRIRKTWVIEDRGGRELYAVREKKLAIRDTLRIERDGDTVATVRKALISPLRDRFKIELENGTELKAKGSIADHRYKIERDGEKIVEVSKKWFKIRDTYGIEISDGEDAPLLLAAAVCIEELGSGDAE